MNHGLLITNEEGFDRLSADGWKPWTRSLALFYFLLSCGLFVYSFLDQGPPLMVLGLVLLFPWSAALCYALFALKVTEVWECEAESFRWKGGALPRDIAWNWSDFEGFVLAENGVHGKLKEGGFLVMGRFIKENVRQILLEELKQRHCEANERVSELRTVKCPGCGVPRVDIADCCEPEGFPALIAMEIGYATGYWLKSINRKQNPYR